MNMNMNEIKTKKVNVHTFEIENRQDERSKQKKFHGCPDLFLVILLLYVN